MNNKKGLNNGYLIPINWCRYTHLQNWVLKCYGTVPLRLMIIIYYFTVLSNKLLSFSRFLLKSFMILSKNLKSLWYIFYSFYVPLNLLRSNLHSALCTYNAIRWEPSCLVLLGSQYIIEARLFFIILHNESIEEQLVE